MHVPHPSTTAGRDTKVNSFQPTGQKTKSYMPRLPYYERIVKVK